MSCVERPQPPNLNRPIVWLDITINGGNAGRLQIELFTDIAPITCENFRALCTGEKGVGKNGKKLHYKGCRFYYIKQHSSVQCGDFINNDGTAGESIYGEPFADETFSEKHFGPGVISMAYNGGRNKNDSRFNITLATCDWLDNKCVVFGRLVHGTTALYEAEWHGTYEGTPRKEVLISDCGQFPKRPINL